MMQKHAMVGAKKKAACCHPNALVVRWWRTLECKLQAQLLTKISGPITLVRLDALRCRHGPLMHFYIKIPGPHRKQRKLKEGSTKLIAQTNYLFN